MQIISDNDFASAMKEFLIAEGECMAVGVSGGADSICLCRMLDRYAKKYGCKVLALTVDHRLRPESAFEAEQVHNWLSALGIPHKTLVWEGDKPLTGIEEKARLARYDLLTAECKKQKIRLLCLAHNKNDNVETFYMRLAKSSGIDGLSGIRRRSVRNGVTVLRPLLGFTREEIKATNEAMGQEWIEDPSNENEMYERVRFRKAKSFFDDLGLSIDAVAKTMEKMARVSTYLQKLQKDFCRRYVLVSDFGFLKINLPHLLNLDNEIAERVLAECISAVGKNGEYTYPLQTAKVCRLLAQIKQKDFKKTTLGGTKIIKKEKNKWLHIIKEERSTEDKKEITEEHIVWDRFSLDFEGVMPTALYVEKLGNTSLPDNLKEVKKLFPADVLKTVPAVRDKDGLLFVPLLGYKRDSDLKCKCTFNPFCF